MNRLATESSPYLLAHSHQAVDWYPWGDEALEAARRRDVPILLSVGYAACHWCHVMSHEVFDDADVAAAMNATFVNVKVDREERPDIDALYMDAFQLMSGRGGWPLTMALDAEGRPFWGATYVPRDKFVTVIDSIGTAWATNRSELLANATNIVGSLTERAEAAPATDTPGIEVVNATLQQLGVAFDPEFGGFGREPKFPQPFHVTLVARAYMASGSDSAKAVITTTLDAMAAGGIRDHIGGGFHRYAVDREWLVPHFEKMLADQAILTRLFRQAFSIVGVTGYRDVFAETIGYVLRELRLPDGGFATAHDADSVGADGELHEGAYYTWTPDQARTSLAPADATVVDPVLAWFHIDDEGDFEIEGRRVSIPNRVPERGEYQRVAAIEAARVRLAAARAKRPQPALDDQVITEWNALMITALADAAMATRNQDWLTAAVDCAEFLLREQRDERGRWKRAWRAGDGDDGGGSASNDASASDYAAVVEALLALYEATGEPRWVAEAVATADTMLDWYWDPVHGGLYRTAEDADPLIVRQKDLVDGATASANSMAASALTRLAALTGEPRYRNHAERIFQLMGPVIKESPAAVSNTLLALEVFHRGFVEVVVSGDRPDLIRLVHMLWRPNQVLVWGEPFDSPLWEGRQLPRDDSNGVAYVCRNGACEAPISTIDDLFRSLTGHEAPAGLTELLTPSEPEN